MKTCKMEKMIDIYILSSWGWGLIRVTFEGMVLSLWHFCACHFLKLQVHAIYIIYIIYMPTHTLFSALPATSQSACILNLNHLHSPTFSYFTHFSPHLDLVYFCFLPNNLIKWIIGWKKRKFKKKFCIYSILKFSKRFSNFKFCVYVCL